MERPLVPAHPVTSHQGARQELGLSADENCLFLGVLRPRRLTQVVGAAHQYVNRDATLTRAAGEPEAIQPRTRHIRSLLDQGAKMKAT